jgi:hypothetical protein
VYEIAFVLAFKPTVIVDTGGGEMRDPRFWVTRSSNITSSISVYGRIKPNSPILPQNLTVFLNTGSITSVSEIGRSLK